MDRFARGIGGALLLAATALHAGCGSGASGLATGTGPGETPAGITNEHPMARPVAVAWTSARAQRCGFYFDPAKLRTAYLNYEAKQGAAGDQLAKIQSSYDSTFKLVSEQVGKDAGYCTDRKGNEIKPDLQRHLAGDFTPNLPKPKPADPCGFFGCTSSSTADQPFDSKEFWKKQDANPKGGGR